MKGSSIIIGLLGIIVRLAVLAAVFVAAVGGGYWGYHQFMASRPVAAATTNIRLVAVTRGDLSATVNTTGSLVPINQARLTFKSGGKLKELNVKVGDRVKAGDVIARIDTTDLEITLAQRLLTLETNKLKLEQGKQGPKKEDIAIAKVNLDKATLNLQKAQADYDKIAWRNDVGMSAQATALQQATLDYQTAQANYAKATAGPSDIDIQVLENTVKATELQIAQDRANIQGATIVAPFDGVISTVGANVGEQVGANTVMATVVDLSNLRIEANIDETDIGKVAVGQEATITLDGLSDVRLRGRVTAIAPNASMQSGVVTYLVYVTLNQADARLRGGMTATANIVVEQRQNVLYVPNRAIKNQRNLRTVQVYQNGELVEKEVRVGLSNDQSTEILAGLGDGDEVAIVTTATNITTGTRGAAGMFGAPTGGQIVTTQPAPPAGGR